jgi:hypothetical protein
MRARSTMKEGRDPSEAREEILAGSITPKAATDSSTLQQQETIRKQQSKGRASEIESNSGKSVDVKVIVPPDDSYLDEIPKLIIGDLFSSKKCDVEKGLQRIAHLCSIPDENAERNRVEIYNVGGHASIVGALKKWFGCPEIQAEGFRALHNTAISDGAFVDAVIKIGVIEVILLGMRNFPDHQNVQISGCGVLYALCYKGQAIVEKFVIEYNGIASIVSAMKRFPKKSLLQKWACGILGIISEIDTLCNKIVESGGLETLVTAIQNHKDESRPYSADIQKKARLAMKRLI